MRRAVFARLAQPVLGFAGVKGVRVGKVIEIELEDAASGGAPTELERRLAKMADEMLANTVIEDYEIRLGRRRDLTPAARTRQLAIASTTGEREPAKAELPKRCPRPTSSAAVE
jgi:phosphoribosylformylglycinamidine synthase